MIFGASRLHRGGGAGRIHGYGVWRLGAEYIRRQGWDRYHTTYQWLKPLRFDTWIRRTDLSGGRYPNLYLQNMDFALNLMNSVFKNDEILKVSP